MAEPDDGMDLDQEDQTITRDDQPPDTIATSDHGNDSCNDGSIPDPIATSDSGGYDARSECAMPDTIATPDYDASGDGWTPNIIVTYDHNHASSKDEKIQDNTVSNVGEACAMEVQSEWIQQHHQSDLLLTLKGDGPSLVGKHPTMIYNFGGHAKDQDDRTSDTIGTTDRDGLSSKDPKPCITATSDPGPGSSRDGRTSFSPETFDHREHSPRDDQPDDTIATHVHGELAVSNVGEGGAMQHHNEVIHVRHQSNVSVTSKGDGPILVGENPTIVNYFNDDESQAREAVEDSKQEIMEAVVGLEERLTNRITNLPQQMKGQVHSNNSVHASDQKKSINQEKQHWRKMQKKMMNALCDMSARQQQAMKQQQEMYTKCINDMISTKTKKENVVLTEQRHIVGHTENWIQEQQRLSEFVKTKAFEIAKEKIKEKRYVVIRGESGAGKTRLAIELLDWLHSPAEEHVFNCKDPLRLPNIQSWDKVISTNSNLSILLDDVLGHNCDVSQDLTWLKQHTDMIKPIVVGNESANYLIITLRNDIYHEYKSKFGYLSLFDDENVIDLSSPDNILEEDRKSLLRVYTPKTNNFDPFSESEIDQIVDYTPAIGFPECCRIFKITPELHIKRVDYFMNPLQSIRTVIKEKFNTGKQTALLYLLLSQEPVSTKRLDFQNESFDHDGITNVFRISSFVFSDSTNSNDCIGIQLQSLQQGLNVLCDSFFVHKEKGIYSFFHDSIRDTIAILYGEVTPSGFLTNCPSSCLHYVATHQCMDTPLCKIVIEKDIYEIAYQRILGELESKQHKSYMTVASMLPWTDEEFLLGFFHWFKTKRHLPEDYFIRWETKEPTIYSDKIWITPFDIQLNVEGDKSSCFLIYAAKMNSVYLLRALVNILDMQKESNHMKHALDVAISEGNVECSTYLLHQNIEPDCRTCFCAARGGNVDLMRMLATSIKALTASQQWDIAWESCAFKRHDVCAYLLGLFPLLVSQRDTHNKHLLHHVASVGSIECFKTVASLIRQDGQCDSEGELSINTLKDKDGNNVLHSAVSSGQAEMMLYLMKEHPCLLTQNNSKDVQCLPLIVIKSINEDDLTESLIDGDGNTILHFACLFGYTELCRSIIRMRPSLLMLTNRNDDHCLHMIAYSNDIDFFKSVAALVLKGITDEESKLFMDKLVNANGLNVLHNACMSVSRNTEMCSYLIREYPSMILQKGSIGLHYLHMIARSGKVECFKSIAAIVLKDKTKTEKQLFMETLKDVNGFTVLHHACMSGQTDMCEFLIREFPSIMSQTAQYGIHCLHLLVLLPSLHVAGRTDISLNLNKELTSISSLMSKICEHGKDGFPFRAQSGQVTIFESVAALVLKGKTKSEKEIIMAKIINDEGATVLHLACLLGQTEMCLYLINEYPSMISQKDRHGNHCLHSIAKSGQVKCFKAVRALVPAGETNSERERFMETLINDEGATVLHQACWAGHTEMCLYLIDEFSSMMLQVDLQGRHILHMISESGEVECFKQVAALVLKEKTKVESERFITALTCQKDTTVLHQASNSGQPDMCLYLMREFPTLINQKDGYGHHCLHTIAQYGYVECFKSVAALVLKDKTRAESELFLKTLLDKRGSNVLFHACFKGKTEMCLYLIKEFPSMKSQKGPNGYHCLHFIALHGHVECFKSVAVLVLEGKAKADSELFMTTLTALAGLTVLHLACTKENTEMCLYLIREFPALMTKKTEKGSHCLHLIARFCGKVECFTSVAALVLKDKRKAERERFMETLTCNGGKSVLHHACVTGNTDMCLYLIREFRSTLLQKGPLGSHCLHLIATSGQVCCFKSVAALVLTENTKEDVERFVEYLTDDYGQTVLHHACVKGQTDMCLYLAGEYPSLLSRTNRYGSHSLHLIAKSGNVDCFKLVATLLLKGKSKAEGITFMETLTNNRGKTVLHKAGVKGKTEMCLYLINELPSLLSKRSRYGAHCLHYIAQSGQVECFQQVADIVMKGKDTTERAKFMKSITNNRGKTVLDKARGNKQIIMCLYLKSQFH